MLGRQNLHAIYLPSYYREFNLTAVYSCIEYSKFVVIYWKHKDCRSESVRGGTSIEDSFPRLRILVDNSFVCPTGASRHRRRNRDYLCCLSREQCIRNRNGQFRRPRRFSFN